MSIEFSKYYRLALAACSPLACAQWALAEEFSLMIGSPVAAQNFQAKSAQFVFRTKGCGKLAKLQVSGNAEGVVNGIRKSIRLSRIAAMPVAGVYALHREWPAEGIWVVNLTGRCDAATASALVPIGPNGFLRESSKFFPRSATEAEIEASLKSLATGTNK